MRSLSNAEKALLCKELGHGRLTVAPTASGRRFRATCECGWNSAPDAPTRTSAREAAMHARWHLDQVVKAYLVREDNGVSVTRFGGRRT